MALLFKGTSFTLSVLALSDADLPALADKLSQKIQQAPGFFQGAPLVVDLAALTQAPDLQAIRDAILGQGMVPVGLVNCPTAHKDQAREAGWALMQQGRTQPAQAKHPKASAPAPRPPAQYFRGQVRSGQQLYAKDRDLVILGTVGAGAEVIADGCIHIYGNLRGRAIAGAGGDVQARIFCRKLEAELVSIAGTYWLSDDLQGEQWQAPTQVWLENEQLAIGPM
ncbi:septum site-determining protein MinC [Gallaecimonas xiamenensis]|uniref:Probable septum site-determining protein MinC n=1 Tax=Gallaecimonas xiamenensis 3-C-1 TaxID=745411 RepID=K2J229_9GAMM|nr:septum site-determining protein MinC [Gallaecimonas xiamenensis]EKE69123.1 septum formation inhibitor [Gallaecimonas xiamenensis 3-C-1]